MAAFTLDTISKKNNDILVSLDPKFAQQIAWGIRAEGYHLNNTAMIAFAGQLFAASQVLEGEKSIGDFDFFEDVALETDETEEEEEVEEEAVA